MAYRYWRVFVDTNNGNSSYTTISSLDFLDSGMSSLIGSGTAIASSEWNPDFTAADGFLGYPDYWSTAPGMSADPPWLGYDFGTDVTVDYFQLTGSIFAANSMPQYMRIEASADATTWDRIAVMLIQTGWATDGTDTRLFDLTIPGPAQLDFNWDQVVHDGYSVIEDTLHFDQPLHDGYSVIQTAFFFSQALQPVFPEGPVSELPLPGFGNSVADPTIPAAANPFSTALPGLSFSVHKKPQFKTNIKEAASGQETRNALMQYPRWTFELTYEFLYDQASGENSLHTLMGFFLARQGSFDSWLFKDPDDYLVSYGYLGTGDGVSTNFDFVRAMGEFYELVGQVDEVNTISIVAKDTDTGSIPTTPWEVTVTEAATFDSDISVLINGSPGTKVTGTPTAGQYAVDPMTGVYTFAAANQGQSYSITYYYGIDSGDYTIEAPNTLIFDTAPVDTLEIYASFQYYFQCRFLEDEQDYEKFMDRLWNLRSCDFRSILT